MSLAETQLSASDLASSQETPSEVAIPSSSSLSSSAASHMDSHHSSKPTLSLSSSTSNTTTTTATTASTAVSSQHLTATSTTTTTTTASDAYSSSSRGPTSNASLLKPTSSSITSPRPISSYYSLPGTRGTSPPSSSSSPSVSAATTSLLMLSSSSSSERYHASDQAIKMEEVTYSPRQAHYHLQYNHYNQGPRRQERDDNCGDHGNEGQRSDHRQSFPHREKQERSSSSSDVHNGFRDAEMKDGSTEPTSATPAITTTTTTTAAAAAAAATTTAPRTKPSSSGTPKATAPAKKRLASPNSPLTSTSNVDGYMSSSSLGMSMTPSPGLRPQSEMGSPRSKNARKEQKIGVTATSCANCGTTTTPLWRRASNGQTICNACGLYFKARNLTRPPWLKRTPGGKKVDGTGDEGDDMDDSTSTHPNTTSSSGAIAPEGSSDSQHNTTSGEANAEDKTNDSECAGSCPGDGNCNGTGGAYSCAGCPSFNQHQANRQSLVCANCRTTTTPLWRRDTGGNTICNACGLYFKLHNVHRPVTMKRAVIKRRKRVNLLASSPPPQEEGVQDVGTPPAKQPKPRQPKSKKVAANASTSVDAMPTASDLEPSEDQGDKGQTPAKRRKLQNTTSPKPVPNIEDFILPKRAANGQTEWMPKAHHHHQHRRSISPIENIGNAHEKDHSHTEHNHSHEEGHEDHDHDHDHGHHTPRAQNHESSYSQPSRDAHAHMRELPPLPHPQEPRYGHSIFHGQYHSSPSMAMSRYPPMHHPSPPRISHPSSQPYSSSPHSHSQIAPHHSVDSRYSPPTHYSRPISMQGYQAPSIHHRHGDMDDSMPTYSPYSSGWNQRLPGYATVSTSANTRLSSTGVVRSSNPGSPPLYPRPVSPSHPYPHSHYRSSGSAHAPLQPGHGYHRQKLPPPTSSSSSSSYSSSFHHILNPVNSEDGNNNDRESAQLPPISMPGNNSNNRMVQHHSLPRASEIIQQDSSHHSQHSPHHYDQHQRRPASPTGSSPMSGVSGALSATSTVAGIPVANTDMLQQTREDLQREVSHLSMLLGRAAAVLNGLDQVLGPNAGGSSNTGSKGSSSPPQTSHAHQGQPGSPTHHSSLSTDMKTNSALASLMALSASGGPDGFNNNSNNNRDDLSSHGPPPPPLSSYHQALPYPLPRRRDRDE